MRSFSLLLLLLAFPVSILSLIEPHCNSRHSFAEFLASLSLPSPLSVPQQLHARPPRAHSHTHDKWISAVKFVLVQVLATRGLYGLLCNGLKGPGALATRSTRVKGPGAFLSDVGAGKARRFSAPLALASHVTTAKGGVKYGGKEKEEAGREKGRRRNTPN